MNAQRWRHSPGLTQVILEKTIIKLGSLLALGFGEASVFKAPRDVASLFSQFAPGWCEHHWAQHAWRRQRLRWCALASFESGLPSEKGQCFRKKEAFFNRTMPSNARSRLFWGSECHAESCWVMLSHAVREPLMARPWWKAPVWSASLVRRAFETSAQLLRCSSFFAR